MKKIVQGCLSILLAMSASSSQAASRPSILRVEVEGTARDALVFEPTAESTGKMPLVLVFHGHGGDMRTAARSWGMHLAWPEAVVVYMQGLPTAVPVLDPDGHDFGWQLDAAQYGGRDLKFVDAALARLKTQYNVDEKRVFAMGFSNGAIFSYLLWSERAALFKAFGIGSGRARDTYHFAQPRPALIMAGRADQVIPFTQQQKAIDAARAADGALGAPESCGDGCSDYASTAGAPVEVIVHDGGHTLPPHPGRAMAEFFKKLGR